MNDEVKEILIDLIDYYNLIGTPEDPGFVPFAAVVERASKALKQQAEEQKTQERRRSSDVDPFAMDVVGNAQQLNLKLEEEW
jgi:hypothetical protein